MGFAVDIDTRCDCSCLSGKKKYLAPEMEKALCSKGLESKFFFNRAYPLGLCHKKEERIFKKYQGVLLAYSYFVLSSEVHFIK